MSRLEEIEALATEWRPSPPHHNSSTTGFCSWWPKNWWNTNTGLPEWDS